MLALQINAGDYMAIGNWGNALTNEAKAVKAADKTTAQVLWKQADEKYLQAINLKTDFTNAHFNRACAFALQSEVGLCCESLTKWKQYNSKASRKDLDSESDFALVTEAPEFKAFYNSLPD